MPLCGKEIPMLIKVDRVPAGRFVALINFINSANNSLHCEELLGKGPSRELNMLRGCGASSTALMDAGMKRSEIPHIVALVGKAEPENGGKSFSISLEIPDLILLSSRDAEDSHQRVPQRFLLAVDHILYG
jgi:hypothetical protein